MSVNASTVERLGRYEVLGEIASGGMATVFLGRVTGAKGFQRLVAIKRLHPHLESEEDFVSMFLDEARLAAKIRHQNVVGTLDVEDQEGLYIVMEFIEGDRLLGLLRHAAKSGERIPIPVAIRIALDTLAGLHAAHELPDDDGEMLGLVHRDVSPQNILVGVDGVARLTDFGIAKATSRLTVTRDGQLKGKIAYMAPEQTKRVEIDRRVDIFAMGIITWEMLTSKKLFTGESDVEVLNQLLFEPIPRLKESAPGIPPAIDAAVMKALERDPAKRYATAAEFADALERASKVVGGPANARTVATHLQKVSAEKIAKDRARISSAGTPNVPGEGQSMAARVRRGNTGAFPAVNTGASLTIPDEPSRPNTGTHAATVVNPPSPPPVPVGRVGKSTMVGMAPPPMPPPMTPLVAPTGPAIKATPSNPPAAPTPSFNAEQTIVDDDEDIPTSAVVRTKELAEALGVPGRALPSSKTPGSAAKALPPIQLPGVAQPAGHAPAVGAPPVPLTRPLSTPPNAVNATPISTAVAVEESKPSSGRRTVAIVLSLALVAGGVGTAVMLSHGPRDTAPVTTTQPAVPHDPIAAPTPPQPTVTNTTGAAAEPTTNAGTPPTPAAVGETPGTAVTPTPAIAAAVDAGATNAQTPPPGNTTATATPPAATTGTHASTSTHGSHSSSHAGTSSANATSTTGSNTTTTTGSHSTTGTGTHTTGTHAGPHEDDPFGTDNPYQR